MPGRLGGNWARLQISISKVHKQRLIELLAAQGIRTASEWVRRKIDEEYPAWVGPIQPSSPPSGTTRKKEGKPARRKRSKRS